MTGAEVDRAPLARAHFRRAALLVGVTISLLVLWQASGWGGERARGAASDFGFVAGAALASLACWSTARERSGRDRVAWTLIALGAACWTLGNVAWTYYLLVVGSLPTPGPPDVGYLAALPLVVTGTLLLGSATAGQPGRLRSLVDGLIMATSLLFLSWLFILHPLWETATQGMAYRVVTLLYPVGDVVLVTVALTLAVRGRAGRRLPFLLLAAGMAVYGVSDSGLAYLAATGAYRQGTLLDAGWILGYLLIALAAMAARAWPPAGRSPAATRSFAVQLLPYAPAVVALGTYYTTRYIEIRGPGDDAELSHLWLSAALVALLLVRVALTMRHDAQLARTLDEQVRARTRELARLARQHASILEAAGEGILGLDRQGVVTFVNRAGASLLHRDAGDMAGRHVHDVVLHLSDDGSPHPWVECPLRQTLVAVDASTRTATSTLERIDGSRIEVEFTISSIVEDNTVTNAVVVFRDVTERLAVERMKEGFISVVSHELRTPLTSIRGALGLLAGGVLGPLPARGQRMVDVAVQSSDRLIRLINDILDVERIAAGRLTLHTEPVSAAALIDDAVAELDDLARHAGVTMRVGAREGTVSVDRDRLTQVLTNLVGNAVKFSPVGGEVLLCSTAQDDDVLFEVRDQGRGIPPDQLEAVFERFQQVDASDSRRKGGTGLGLAICRGLVEQHGGRIWATSGPGEGATFRFTLPAVPSPVAQHGGTQDTAPAVLVCDDDPATVEVLAALLESRGFATLRAGGGEEAVELAASRRPAAVVLDLLMPGMSGWEVAAALKERPETADIPIVILSVLGPEEAALDQGAPDVDAWMCKPPDPGALLATLEQAMQTRSEPRVLIVEDDDALSQVLTVMFERHRVRTAVARTGHEAVRRCQAFRPHLLILDLNLPGGDGFSVIDALRRDDRLRLVPVVVYTAAELPESDRSRLRLGRTEFFTKARTPPQELEEQVVTLLDRVVGRAVTA